MRHSLILAALAGATVLCGCAVVDTGQVDYRVAEPPPASTVINKKLAECAALKLDCRTTESALIRKYVPAQSPFVSTEVYSIELEQAVVGTRLLEGNFFGKELGKKGEFAILANAFEFGDEAHAKRFLQAPEYDKAKQSDTDVELKLVYFGDDVARMQPLNFSNIPLMPRAPYNGGSIGIQIVIMEVDAQSAPVASLLKTLAKFGQSTIPGPPEATSILFNLGESLLQGSQDDRLFDYRFVMSSGASIDSEGKLGPTATFAPGRYIFRRAQQRTAPLVWNDLTFDYNTGRLYRGGAEVRDELYFVLNVRKYPAGTTSEGFEQASWTQFRDAVQRAADARDAPINAVTDNLISILVHQRSSKWKGLLSERWHTAETKLRGLSAKTLQGLENVSPAPGDAVCAGDKAKALLVRDLADREAQDAVRQFLADYQAAKSAAVKRGDKDEPELAMEDREALVSVIARYFMPWTDDLARQSFSDASAFEQKYATGGELWTLSRSTATQRGIPVSDCASLRQVTSSWL